MAWVCTGGSLRQFGGASITQYCYSQYKMVTIALGWLFVVGAFALAYATAPGGTVLGALFALVLGTAPLAVLLYVVNAAARRRRARGVALSAGSRRQPPCGR